jgi:PHD/YefM family antitoxin component YafN of YafNO toxin-antitoxin module
MKTINISQARQNIFSLADEVVEFSEQILVTGKKHNIVLVSEDDWNAIQETLYLTSIPGFVESIREAEKEPESELVSMESINWDV